MKQVDRIERVAIFSDITNECVFDSKSSEYETNLGCEVKLHFGYFSQLGDCENDIDPTFHLSAEETKTMLSLLFIKFPQSEYLNKLKELNVF